MYVLIKCSGKWYLIYRCLFKTYVRIRMLCRIMFDNLNIYWIGSHTIFELHTVLRIIIYAHCKYDWFRLNICMYLKDALKSDIWFVVLIQSL